MKRENKGHTSIYVQLGRLLLLSSVLAAICYVVLDRIGMSVIDYYIYDGRYVEEQNAHYISKLVEFVDKEKIATSDSKKLDVWVKEQEILTLEIYKNNIQVFTSNDPNKEESANRIEMSEESWIGYAQVQFADGAADVMVTGIYSYQLRLYTRIFVIILSFIFLIVVVLLGIRRKVEDIRRLSHDLEILEGGNLDYQIHVKGRDELADLAQGVESMRLSFRNLVQTEADIVKKNQKVITEMSHDLRTPVTSILLYLEIIKNKPNMEPDLLQHYLGIIEQKAQQMRQVSENLFSYSLVAEEMTLTHLLPLSHAVEVMCEGLTLQGLSVEVVAEEELMDIELPSDSILRIMDNLQSNIIKYGDPAFPVRIGLKEDEKWLELSVSNKIGERSLSASNGIGLQSIERMVVQLGGDYAVHEEQGWFCVCIHFSKSQGELQHLS